MGYATRHTLFVTKNSVTESNFVTDFVTHKILFFNYLYIIYSECYNVTENITIIA
jgi:hypothetical protein